MSAQLLPVASGRRAAVAEIGRGRPVLYLHDFIDVHGSNLGCFPVHHAIAARCRLIALAHAGCANSDEDDHANGILDAVFHVLETLDALDLKRLPVVGVGIGGWIAAELAVHHPGLVERLVLIGATGLLVPEQPIADIFYASYPTDGRSMHDLRKILFADADSQVAKEHVPDGMMSVEQEMLRYRMFRFANRIGFHPPYLYDRQLIGRLPRYRGPTLVLAGECDGFVPTSHAYAYSDRLPKAVLRLLPGAGHAVHLERGADVSSDVLAFLEG